MAFKKCTRCKSTSCNSHLVQLYTDREFARNEFLCCKCEDDLVTFLDNVEVVNPNK